MKIKYLIFMIAAFISFNICAKAMLPLCAYDSDETSIGKNIMTTGRANPKAYLMYEGTRVVLYINYVDKTSLTKAKHPIPGLDWIENGYNNLNYYQILTASDGTTIKFNPYYESGKFVGAGIKNTKTVGIHWWVKTDHYNTNDVEICYTDKCINDPDAYGCEICSDPLYKDPKKEFAEKAECPQYLFYDGTSLTEFKDGATLNFATNRESALKGEDGLFDDNNVMYKLSYSLVDFDYPLNDSTVTKSDGSTLTIPGIKGLFQKIIVGEVYNLSDTDLQRVIDTLNLSYGPLVKASDTERYMFTKILNQQGVGLFLKDEGVYMATVNYIISMSQVKNSQLSQDKYKELVEAAKNYKAYTTGKKEIIQPNELDKCKAVLGDVNDKESFAYYLQMIFNFVQFAGPILVIVLTTVDYFKAIFGDEGNVKKVNKRTVTRLIAVVLLFFIPVFIKILLNLFDIVSDCGIS